MENPKFTSYSFDNSLKTGIRMLKEHALLFAKVDLIYFPIVLIIVYLGRRIITDLVKNLRETAPWSAPLSLDFVTIDYLYQLLSNIFLLILLLGSMSAALRLFDGRRTRLSHFLPRPLWVINWVVTSLIVYIVGMAVITLFYVSMTMIFGQLMFAGSLALLGLIFFVILLLVVFLLLYYVTRLIFYPFIIVDYNAGPFKSIGLSLKLTSGPFKEVLKLMLFFVIYFIFNFFGTGTVIGVIITLPISLGAHAYMYRYLQATKLGPQEQPPHFAYLEEELARNTQEIHAEESSSDAQEVIYMDNSEDRKPFDL